MYEGSLFMQPEIIFENRGAVLVLTFNRPEFGNRFTGSAAKAINEKIKSVGEDRAVRAVLLRGTGQDFMQGHEIRPYAGEINTVQDQVFQKVQYFYNVIRELSQMDKPVICAVQGLASMAGLNFVAVSDYVVAGRGARFSGGYAAFAMVPDGGITYFLPRKIGLARAAEMLMSDEAITAEQALGWGLINRVVDDAALEAEAFAVAERMAAGPTRIYGSTKRLLGKSNDQDLNAQLSLEAAYWNTCSKSFDFREAMKAFLAQKPPKFTGS